MSRKLNKYDLKKIVIYVIVPGLAHLAISSIKLLGSDYPIVVINNGLDNESYDRLKKALPLVHFIKMRNNKFFGNYMVTPHMEVLNTYACIAKEGTIFIDADCYVFNPMIMDEMWNKISDSFLVTPFWHYNSEMDIHIPDTFLFGVNGQQFLNLRQNYGVSFGANQFPSRLKNLAHSKWGKSIPWPHPWKKYFDTVHIPALSASLLGLELEMLKYNRGDLYHVSGTSYTNNNLQPSRSENDHILNAHYFHLLMIETFEWSWAKKQFKTMIDHYKSAQKLLFNNPGYKTSLYRLEIDELVQRLKKRMI